LALVIGVAVTAPACAKPSSENIQLWKTTQKGPERLHDALADSTVAPRLRAEAAAALVDIARADDAEAVMAQIPAGERSEILKTLIPIDEVAMKDPSPDKSLAARDALFSIRGYATPEDQKQIDSSLLPAIANDLRTGRLRNGRHSIEKVLTAIGPDSGAMLADVLGDPVPSYPLTADLLGKVGDETARNKGATALIARAQKEKAKDKEVSPSMWKAIGSVGGPVAIKFLEDKAQGSNHDEAGNAVRALGARRDPQVLPFALKVAGDPKADKLVRDEMFGVIEGIGGLEARKGLLAIISSDRERVRGGDLDVQGRGDRAGARRVSCRRGLQESRRRRPAGPPDREAGRRGAAGAAPGAGFARAAHAHDRGDGAGAGGCAGRRPGGGEDRRRQHGTEGLPNRRNHR
jgi:hypothetical protein